MSGSRLSVLMLLGTGALAIGSARLIAHPGGHDAPAAPFDLTSPRTPSPETAKYIGLQTAEVDFGSVDQVERLSGVVRVPADRVQVVSPALAGVIERVNVTVGQRVKRGDVIAEVRSAEFTKLLSELAGAEIEIAKVENDIVAARSSFEQTKVRATTLEQQALLAEAEAKRMEAGGEAIGANLLGQKKAAAIAARAEAGSATMAIAQHAQAIEALERMLGATQKSIAARRELAESIRGGAGGGAATGVLQLRAAMDGVVTHRDGSLGEAIEPGRVIVRVVDDSRLQVEGEVPESRLAMLSGAVGNVARVRLSTEGSYVAAGKVLAIGPTIDPVKRTGHVLVEVASDAKSPLRDGMFVRLSVVVREAKDVVVVPLSAVINEGPMHFVFVKEKDSYIKHDIVPGARDDRVVEVVEGLAPGDVVVVKGAYALTQLRPAGAAGAAAHDDHDHGHAH